MASRDTPPPPDDPPDADGGWTQLWERISKLPWRSLALVPTGGSGHALHAMELLHAAALTVPGYPVEKLDATRVPAAECVGVLATHRYRHGRQRLLVAVHEPMGTPHAVAVARAADVAVLVIPLGTPQVSDARVVMDLVGAQRFVGCITLDSAGRGRYA